jgi:hypothetical protein
MRRILSPSRFPIGMLKKRHILRHNVKQPGGTRFTGFSLDVDLNIRRIVPVRITGENIDGSGFQRTSLIFAEENTPELLRHKYEHLISRSIPQVHSARLGESRFWPIQLKR